MSLPEGDCVAGCTTATSGCAAFVLQQTLDDYGYVNSRCVRYSQPLQSSLPLPGLTAPSLPSAVGVRPAVKGSCGDLVFDRAFMVLAETLQRCSLLLMRQTFFPPIIVRR